MRVKGIAIELFRRRQEASFVGYIPTVLVVVFFGLYALHEGFVETVPYLALLAICLIQFRFRTLGGWLFFLIISIWYALEVAFDLKSASGYGEYVFFIACGAVPALFLLLSCPLFKKTASSRGPSAAGAK